MLILGLALAITACGDDITADRIVYRDTFFVNPAADLSFNELVTYGEGALFQRFNRSLRFFDDGQFRSTAVGLNPGNALATAVGNRWELVSESRLPDEGWQGLIQIFHDTDTPATAASYTIAFTLIRHQFVITEVLSIGEGLAAPAGGIPTAANLPRGPENPYNWGRVPNWQDDGWTAN